MASKMDASSFDMKRHVKYFRMHANTLPDAYKSMDTNRLTLLYFSISGLDLLGALDQIEASSVVEYIYSLQSPLADHGGFYGYPRVHFDSEELDKCNNQPHIANTYCALVMLLILGDDLSKVDRKAVAHSLQKWQLPDGSFCCVHGVSNLDSENDIRFVYCAACICYILDLWDAIDVELMLQNILATRTYDGAFGMGPCTEAHGGCTYCAVAALAMMGRLQDLPRSIDLIDWCVKRQNFGFQGRIEKPSDTCYSFWVGGTMKLIGAQSFLQEEPCLQFLSICEDRGIGGFRKLPESRHADLLHSYFSVCGLSLCGVIQPLHVMLNMSERAFNNAKGGIFRTASRQAVPASIVSCVPALDPPPRREQQQEDAAPSWIPLKPAQLVVVSALLLPVLLRLWRFLHGDHKPV